MEALGAPPMAIKELESEFNTVLFSRSGKKLLPTKEGDLFFALSTPLINQIEMIKKTMAESCHPANSIHLGLTPMIDEFFFTPILKSFLQKYPDMHISLSEQGSEQLEESIKNDELDCALITHTAESSLIAEVLAQYRAENDGVNITIVTETIHNLYEMLSNYEVDLAIVEGRVKDPSISALLLDTDYLVCVMSNNHPLARQSMVTIGDLRQERMILRLPNSGTRNLLESHLESLQMDLSDFNVVLEVDNIATIKDLIRKDMGISILARSACMDELRKGKLTALPIENLSMIRETNLLYHRDFEHTEILRALTKLYNNAARLYQ